MKNLIWVPGGVAVALIAAAMAWVAGGVAGQTTAPADGTSPRISMDSARMSVQLLALNSPNPFVREMAYHDHDADWALDLKTESFSLKIPALGDLIVKGKLQPLTQSTAIATFDDAAALSRDWIVPEDSVLKLDDAIRCMMEMGERMGAPDSTKRPDPNQLKGLCAAMKGVEFNPDAPNGTFKAAMNVPGRENSDWTIDLSGRTFRIYNSRAGADTSVIVNFSGRFGWDKDRHWTAWPVEMSRGAAAIAVGISMAGALPVIPDLNFALRSRASASSALDGHSAKAVVDGDNATFWQPAADDAHPTWTVDLKTRVSVTSVRMVFVNELGFRRPTMEISDDEKTWRAAAEIVPGGRGRGAAARGVGGSPVQTFTMPADTTGRYVRLTFPSAPPATTTAPATRPTFGTRGPSGETIQLAEVTIDGTVKRKE